MIKVAGIAQRIVVAVECSHRASSHAQNPVAVLFKLSHQPPDAAAARTALPFHGGGSDGSSGGGGLRMRHLFLLHTQRNGFVSRSQN